MLGDLATELLLIGVHSIVNQDGTVGVVGVRKRGEKTETEWFGRQVSEVRYVECEDPLLDPIQLTKTDGGWSYQNEPHEVFGYIELERIRGTVPSIGKLTQLCLDYYSRPPETVAGWPIPIHQHPDWSLSDIARAIENAEEVSEAKAVSLMDVGFAKIQQIFDRQRSNGEKLKAPGELYYYPVSKSGEVGHAVSFKRHSFLLLRCDFKRAYKCVRT